MRLILTMLFAAGLVFLGHDCAVAAESPEETLEFRHEKAATVRFLDRKLAEDYQRRLRSVGCTATVSWHWGHTDLTYQCEDWHVLRCSNHAEAMDWMKFFAILCFEASHLH